MFSFIIEPLDISATSCNRISEFLRTCTFLFKRIYNTVILLHPFYNITTYFVTKKGNYTIYKHKKYYNIQLINFYVTILFILILLFPFFYKILFYFTNDNFYIDQSFRLLLRLFTLSI